MSVKEIHMVCNAHLDPVWLWSWEEGAAAALSTFRSAARLAKKYDFIFCHNEMLLYKWTEEYDPQLFREIQTLVREGKWHIMGGWYLQPDCNMPNGESLVRQIRTGQRYFKEKFGIESFDTAVNLDSFGHSIGLVQILQKTGYKNYIVCRPHHVEKQGMPKRTFIWRGLDGSRVKVLLYDMGYASSLGNVGEKLELFFSREEFLQTRLFMWGVGNHGGGPSEKDLQYLKANENKNGYHLVHSTLDAYFETMQPTETFKKSLNRTMPGCYSSLIRIKQKHRRLENELFFAEKIATAAVLNAKMEYPYKELNEAQEALLFGEFHDVLPGTCIKAGEDSALNMFDYGISLAERVRMRAFYALSSQTANLKENEYPVFVFNPHPYPVTTTVECEFVLANQNWSDIYTKAEVFDGDKKLCTQQIIESSSLTLDWVKRIAFECKLAPCGVSRFLIRTSPNRKKNILGEGTIKPLIGKNSCLTIDEKSGYVKSMVFFGKEYLTSPIVPTVFTDNEDPWAMGANQLQSLGEKTGTFSLICEDENAALLKNERAPLIRIIEDGKVFTTAEAIYRYNHSKITIQYKVYKKHPRIDLKLKVLWQEQNKMLKARSSRRCMSGVGSMNLCVCLPMRGMR